MFIEQQFSKPEPKEQLRDFFHLSEEEKAELHTRVEQWNGLIRIFVHPMFEKWRGIKNHENKKLEKIIEVVARLSAMESEQTPPIIFMEEASHLEELKKWFEQGITDECSMETRNHMYLIPTEDSGTSDPQNQSWEDMRKALDELGVKKILIGGMQLTFSESEQGTYYHRCLGTAITELSEDGNGDFEIELSNLSYPEGRAEQRDLKDKKPRV